VTILYITYDGVTDHIGRSQVAPYLFGLAQKGFKIHVVSAEKTGREELIRRYQRDFDKLGIRWTRVRYWNKPPILGQALTHFCMRRAASSVAKAEGIRVVHCRCFAGALIGRALKRALGTKLIFDFRDFYADSGLVKSRGLRRLIYARLKQLEGPLVRDADKIVCLTHRARQLLSDWYLRDDPRPEWRFQVVPCCADFSHFDHSRLSAADIERARERAGVRKGNLVLLYLGSLGQDYLLPQMMVLFAQMLKARPKSQFLFVCNNGKDLVEREYAAKGIPSEKVLFTSADREEVPAFLALADLSVVFIRADTSKAGCSPTKLAELFACGVPVIANSGVGDLDSIIDPQKNGSVLVNDFSDESLSAAVNSVLAVKRFERIKIRENSRDFSLGEGVARYSAVYSELLGVTP
jgi:glycosyltransferase involved in cell wall biosynthesis